MYSQGSHEHVQYLPHLETQQPNQLDQERKIIECLWWQEQKKSWLPSSSLQSPISLSDSINSLKLSSSSLSSTPWTISSNDKVFLTLFFLGAALTMAYCWSQKSEKAMATIFTAFLASDICNLLDRLVLSWFSHVPPTQTVINRVTVVNDHRLNNN